MSSRNGVLAEKDENGIVPFEILARSISRELSNLSELVARKECRVLGAELAPNPEGSATELTTLAATHRLNLL